MISIQNASLYFPLSYNDPWSMAARVNELLSQELRKKANQRKGMLISFMRWII